MNLAGIPTSPGRHPRRTSPFGRWRRGLVTMAILLLDRWLQPPLPPPPPPLPSPPATLSTLPTSFVHSACHRYDEPIAHSEKIFNHASRTRPVTVVVVEEKEGERKRIESPPHDRHPPYRWGTKVDGGGGRTAPFHYPLSPRPPPPPPPPPFAKYDGIIKCLGLHIQNQWLRTFDVRTGVGGIYLLPHQTRTPGFARRGGGWMKAMDGENFAADILSNRIVVTN